MADINRMLRGSVAIYCEAPKAVADDISYMLRTGAEEIETLRTRVARLEEALRRVCCLVVEGPEFFPSHKVYDSVRCECIKVLEATCPK